MEAGANAHRIGGKLWGVGANVHMIGAKMWEVGANAHRIGGKLWRRVLMRTGLVVSCGGGC